VAWLGRGQARSPRPRRPEPGRPPRSGRHRPTRTRWHWSRPHPRPAASRRRPGLAARTARPGRLAAGQQARMARRRSSAPRQTPSGGSLLPVGAPWFFPSRVGLTRPSHTATQGRQAPRHSAAPPSMSRSRSRPPGCSGLGCELSAARGAARESGYFYVAARRGVCPIQGQGTNHGPAPPGVRGRGWTGLLGTGPRAMPLRVAPSYARGHVVSSRDEARNRTASV
jgi:hypothetical protein